MNRHERILDRERSLLLVIDMQESYRGKLHREDGVVAAARRRATPSASRTEPSGLVARF